MSDSAKECWVLLSGGARLRVRMSPERTKELLSRARTGKENFVYVPGIEGWINPTQVAAILTADG